MIMHRRN